MIWFAKKTLKLSAKKQNFLLSLTNGVLYAGLRVKLFDLKGVIASQFHTREILFCAGNMSES